MTDVREFEPMLASQHGARSFWRAFLVASFRVQKIEFLQIGNRLPDVGEHLVRRPSKRRSKSRGDVVDGMLSVAQIPDRACSSIEPVHCPAGTIQYDQLLIDNSRGEPRAR